MKNIEVLYEDDSCAVFNKPQGLAVQGGQGVKKSLDSILANEYKNYGLFERPLLVHRLDKDTSGLILLAKTAQDAAYYSKIIFNRETEKLYRAMCWTQNCGQMKTEGEISSIIEIKGVKKEALTYYKILERRGDFSLFELRLGTGRMHQIRRHLSLKNCPVIGDEKYGSFKLNRELRKKHGIKNLLLHAYRIKFKAHFGGIVDVYAPLPPPFEAFFANCL